MDCPYEDDIETAERYVSGAMTEADQTAFEGHYFACERCLADVRALQDLWQVMAAAPRPTRAAPRRTAWALAGLAAAASIGLVLVVVNARRHTAPGPSSVVVRAPEAGATSGAATGSTSARPPSTGGGQAAPGSPGNAPAQAAPSAGGGGDRRALLRQLAVVVAPTYVRLTTRGGEAEATPFDAAMGHYAAGRYARAAEGLRALAGSGTPVQAAHASFFLGICELMQGHAEAARDQLERVSAAGIAPYADESHFYLAKAALASADVDAARRELAVAIERDAGPEGEAARLLARLR